METGWLELVQAGGVTGALLLFLVGGLRRWWVFGHHYTEMERDRDWWRNMAMGGTAMAEKAVDLAEYRRAGGRG